MTPRPTPQATAEVPSRVQRLVGQSWFGRGSFWQGRVRWGVCALLFAAVVLSYLDRLVLGVLKPELALRYSWTNSGYGDITGYFQICYGLGFLGFGWLIDKLGARVGYLLAMSIWTAGHFLQMLPTTTAGFVLARMPLALGESGTFPAALSVVSQWFPVRERAFAIGIFNAGANIGAIVTPLLVPILLLNWGWRSAFLVTGVVNFIWLFVWFRWYQKPALHPALGAAERAYIEAGQAVEPSQAVTANVVEVAAAPAERLKHYQFRDLLKVKQTWAYMLGRFLIDPVWWTFLFWLPDFFSKTYGFNLKAFGLPLVVIYLLADVGAVLGGFSSSRMLKKGVALGRARKLTMFFAACLAVPVAFAPFMSSFWGVVLVIGAACAAHQGFSTNLFAIPGDLFPQRAQGKLAGLGGFAGALGGFLAAKSLGWLLDSVGSYTPFFIACGAAYLVAWLVTHALNSQYSKPVWRTEL